jgi:hypothetical protein
MPLYNVAAPSTFIPPLGLLIKGRTLDHVGWPKVSSGKLEPVDEDARRIVDYFEAHRGDAAMRSSPYDPAHGRIYLPHYLAQPSGDRLPPLPSEPIEGAPKWRTRWQLVFGKQTVPIGSLIEWCAWPCDDLNLEPANEVAEEIAAYYASHKNHPGLPSSPWCDFQRAPFLPELPPIRPKKYAADMTPWRDAAYDEFQRGNVERAQASLRKIAHSAARRGSR